MQEPQWDDSIEDSKDIFEAALILPEDDASEPERITAPKSHITELRRRIEERMDSKRIDHEFDYDDLDSLLDQMN